ncbi:hypothetical protein Bca52824_024852 [Brassica carinata]|uniref:KIB1-4 beta-propeller domain-containing protein n=1 Tax=Brassica carinata TaxID=52824 RepID=A0A8X7VL10_BRACI|nr:hypothetical protein Bca52824_024852 [Brassica carinata]
MANVGSPWLMLFLKAGDCVLYKPKEGGWISIKVNIFSLGFPYLILFTSANSGNWFLVLDSGSNLYITDVFSKKTIPLPPLESIRSSTSIIKRVGSRGYVREDPDVIFMDLSSDVSTSWVWFFDLPVHSYISFCKRGDTHYTDIPLFYQDSHRFHGLSEMVLRGYRLYITTSRRHVRVLDLSERFFKDITDGTPFQMLSEVLLVESDPCDRSWFRLYKKDPDIENPDCFSHTVLEVDSLGGEALLLDLGFTVPANDALGVEPDCIYFTRHYRPCQCAPRDLDICVFNLASKTLKRFPHLDDMKNLMDARWFLPGN